MKIRMNELLDSLVRTVTEDAEVREIRASDHLTAVRSRRWGLASRLGRAGADPRAVDQELLDGLLPMTALELASLARDRSPERASIGVAALNSVLPESRVPLEQCSAQALIGRRGADSRVMVIGHFPFIERLGSSVGSLTVFEQPERLRPGDLPSTSMAAHLPEADLVAITGSTLVNHTLPGILELVRSDAYCLLLGPTTPLAPCLFEQGLDALCGSIVEEPRLFLAGLARGVPFREARGVRKVVLVRESASEPPA